MRLKLETSHEPDTTVTIDDEQAVEDYPQLDTPPGHVSLRIDDASEGGHTVTQAQLNPTEALTLSDVLLQFGESALEEEQRDKRSRSNMLFVGTSAAESAPHTDDEGAS